MNIKKIAALAAVLSLLLTACGPSTTNVRRDYSYKGTISEIAPKITLTGKIQHSISVQSRGGVYLGPEVQQSLGLYAYGILKTIAVPTVQELSTNFKKLNIKVSNEADAASVLSLVTSEIKTFCYEGNTPQQCAPTAYFKASLFVREYNKEVWTADFQVPLTYGGRMREQLPQKIAEEIINSLRKAKLINTKG